MATVRGVRPFESGVITIEAVRLEAEELRPTLKEKVKSCIALVSSIEIQEAVASALNSTFEASFSSLRPPSAGKTFSAAISEAGSSWIVGLAFWWRLTLAEFCPAETVAIDVRSFPSGFGRPSR